MAIGSVLCGLLDRTRFGWQLKHFSIRSLTMLVNKGCHLPSFANISLNSPSCIAVVKVYVLNVLLVYTTIVVYCPK